MSISRLTKLEHDVLSHIFEREFGKSAAMLLLSRLLVTKRKFSTSDGVNCMGSYTYFSKIYHHDVYAGTLQYANHDHANHPQLEAGVGFILFTTGDKTAFEFLEMFSYGHEELAIHLLTDDLHQFEIIW